MVVLVCGVKFRCYPFKLFIITLVIKLHIVAASHYSLNKRTLPSYPIYLTGEMYYVNFSPNIDILSPSYFSDRRDTYKFR